MTIIDKLYDLTNKMVNCDSNSDSDVQELVSLSYELNYEKMFVEHFILDSETILKTLNFFELKNDIEKCEFLATVLNSYYLESFIMNEEYEKCAIIKRFIK